MPPSSATAGIDLQRIVDVLERLLDPERDQDDPGDHQEVQVRVGVARHLVLLAADRRALQPPRRDQGDDVEYIHHMRRREPDADHGGHALADAERLPDADPDRDDRLAQGDDHDQAVALGEVAGHELPALEPRDSTGRPCRAPAPAPRATPWAARRGSMPTTSSATPIAVLIAKPQIDRRRLGLVAARDHEQSQTCAARTTA